MRPPGLRPGCFLSCTAPSLGSPTNCLLLSELSPGPQLELPAPPVTTALPPPHHTPALGPDCSFASSLVLLDPQERRLFPLPLPQQRWWGGLEGRTFACPTVDCDRPSYSQESGGMGGEGGWGPHVLVQDSTWLQRAPCSGSPLSPAPDDSLLHSGQILPLTGFSCGDGEVTDV